MTAEYRVVHGGYTQTLLLCCEKRYSSQLRAAQHLVRGHATPFLVAQQQVTALVDVRRHHHPPGGTS